MTHIQYPTNPHSNNTQSYPTNPHSFPDAVITASISPPFPSLRANVKYRQDLSKTLAPTDSHSTKTCISNRLQKKCHFYRLAAFLTVKPLPLDTRRVYLWNFFPYYSFAVSSSQMGCPICPLLSKDAFPGLLLLS